MESKDKKSKEKSFLDHWLIIYCLCLIFGFIFGFGFNFFRRIEVDINTLYWMTSTIAQGFSAMIAIVIVLSIYYRGELAKEYEKASDRLKLSLEDLPERGSDNYNSIIVAIKNEYETKKLEIIENREKFRFKNNPFFQSTFLLIFNALFFIALSSTIDGFLRLDYANFFKLSVLWYLLIHSFYCLVLLSERIYDVL